MADDESAEDLSQIAKRVVDETTKEPEEEVPEKNPNAVALGRLGGLKGGPARARKLSKIQRTEIAKKAARARWEKDAER